MLAVIVFSPPLHCGFFVIHCIKAIFLLCSAWFSVIGCLVFMYVTVVLSHFCFTLNIYISQPNECTKRFINALLFAMHLICAIL